MQYKILLKFSFSGEDDIIADNCPKACFVNIGIKHVFSCINVCQVPRELLKTEATGLGFQQLPRDLANVNAWENNV